VLVDEAEKKVRLDEMTRALFGKPVSELDITRTAIFGRDKEGRWITPLDV
jgi:hypothetical protein